MVLRKFFLCCVFPAVLLAGCGDAPHCDDPAAMTALRGVFLDRLSEGLPPTLADTVSSLKVEVEPSLIGHRDTQATVSRCSAAVRVQVDGKRIARTLAATAVPYWQQVGQRWRLAIGLPARDDLLAQIRAVAQGAPGMTPRQKARLDALLGVDVTADPAAAAQAAASFTAQQPAQVGEIMRSMQLLLSTYDTERATVALQADYTVARASGGEGEARMTVEAQFEADALDGLRALQAWLQAMREVDALPQPEAGGGARADAGPAETRQRP